MFGGIANPQTTDAMYDGVSGVTYEKTAAR